MTTEKNQRKGPGSNDGCENCYESAWREKRPEGSRWKGWACNYCTEKGHLSKVALRCLNLPRLPDWSVKDHNRGENAPRGVGPRGQDLRTIRTKCARSPHTGSCPNNTWGTQVLVTVGGQSIDFLLGTGANFSVLTEAPSPLSSQSTTGMGPSGWAKRCYFSHPLSCNWDSVLFFSHVSDHPRVSFTPSWEGYIEQGPDLCFHDYGACSFPPINWTKFKS